MSLFLYMSFTDIYDWFAKDFLHSISCCVSSRFPTYLHVFHWSDPFLSTVYFSVFDSFTSRFLFFSIWGTVFSISLISSLFVLAHPISSAYCWSMIICSSIFLEYVFSSCRLLFLIKIFKDIAKYNIKKIALALSPCGDPIFVIYILFQIHCSIWQWV